MPRQLPPIETRFPVNRKDRQPGHGPYLTPLLRKLLERKIKYIDFVSKKIVSDTVRTAILGKLASKALKGNLKAMEMVFDRDAGKPVEAVREEEQNYLAQEEIDLIPSDGNGKINRIKDYLAKQQ